MLEDEVGELEPPSGGRLQYTQEGKSNSAPFCPSHSENSVRLVREPSRSIYKWTDTILVTGYCVTDRENELGERKRSEGRWHNGKMEEKRKKS